MKIKTLTDGYAHRVYEVTAEENETLTREKLEDRFGYPFGCDVRYCNDKKAEVKVYLD